MCGYLDMNKPFPPQLDFAFGVLSQQYKARLRQEGRVDSSLTEEMVCAKVLRKQLHLREELLEFR